MRGCLLLYGRKIEYVVGKNKAFVERYVRIYELTSFQCLGISIFVTRFEKIERTAKLFINQFYYSMKKKIYGALVLGSLLLSGGMVSCSDYDDDINSLNERVDGIEKTLADLKAKIEAGAVITKVENTSNGVKVTLSNGESFELTNGKNGADGADGKPGSTVSVDSEGYWTIDGERVTVGGKPIKAEGEKGDQGEAGTPGEDGKDGKWYEPNEDGFWYECAYNEEGEVVKTKTENQWVPATDEGVRVVYNPDEGYMLIYGAEGTDEAIRIDITSDLKSLAVIPYVLDKETNYPLTFFYNIMGSDVTFGDIEKGEGSANVNISVATSTKAKAHYRLNPANANTQDWTWSMIDRVVARAAGDNNELLTVANTEKKDGELIVTLKSNKSLEDLANEPLFKEHAIAALQGTNKDTKEVITSDYIKVSSKDLRLFSIITGYDLASGDIFKLPFAGEEINPAYDSRTPDFKFVYTESLDLNPLIKTWAEEVVSAANIPAMVDDMVDAGELKYEFTLPAEYKLGGNQTNQQDFVTLEGSVLKVNTNKYPNGTGAIGGTPIVWVRALVNNKTIATAVIKVVILKEDQVEKPAHVVTVDPISLEYSNIKAGKVENKFTWDAMRKVYDDLKISREEFIQHYKKYTITDNNGTPAWGGFINGVGLYNWSDGQVGTQTNAIEMVFDPTQVPSNVEDGLIKITYMPDNTYAYAPIVIEFPYTVSHKHQLWPNFNDQFVQNDIALIKGQTINGVWTQEVEISEHFANLDSYKPEGNHGDPRLVIEDVDANLTLTGSKLHDQTLKLSSEIVGASLDVPAKIVETLANGEVICVKEYTIRFVNPFTMVAKDVKLEAVFPGKMDEEAINYTVKDKENKEVINSQGKVTAYGKQEYGLTDGDVTVTYSEGVDWASFGVNNDGTNKLTMDKNVPSIKWENKGTALVKPVKTTYTAKVTVKGIAIMTDEGAVTVTETDM